jgi:hypothetical protein
MGVGVRVVLVVMAAMPLLAPYELLVRVDWQDRTSPSFVIAALASAGAAAVTALFLFAAVAGTGSRIVVDRRSATIASTVRSPIVRRSRVFPLGDLVDVELGVQDWSDGGPTYHVRIAMADGTLIRTGATPSRDEAEAVRAVLAGFLAAPSPGMMR